MRYDLSNPLHREQLATRYRRLTAKQSGIIELREVRPARSLRQNNYLHTLIAYFALQVGERADDVKREYYKLAANRQLFAICETSRVTGEPVTRLRSTTALTTDEMALSIDRFRNWASQVAGIYLPSASDMREVELMELEVERAKEYL